MYDGCANDDKQNVLMQRSEMLIVPQIGSVAPTAPDSDRRQHHWCDAAQCGGPHLLACSLPENMREVRNVIQRVATLVRRPMVVAADLDFLDSAETQQACDWLAGPLPEAVERV
jgi:hypothetical protein